jgi:TonB family protein
MWLELKTAMIFIPVPEGLFHHPSTHCLSITYSVSLGRWIALCVMRFDPWLATAPQRNITNMPLRRLWFLAGIISISSLCLGSIGSAPEKISGGQVSLAEREQHVWSSAVHDSEFATVAHPAARVECGAGQPPQALATPDPLLDDAGPNSRVSVSFVIGTDGRVHSALILESAGPSEDRTILDAVRFWRYRPALCNGVPTEAEAKVEFSSR